MRLPDLNSHALNRISLGLARDQKIDEFTPPLSEDEKVWYRAMEKDREDFKREHPEIKDPIWEIPFDYD